MTCRTTSTGRNQTENMASIDNNSTGSTYSKATTQRVTTLFKSNNSTGGTPYSKATTQQVVSLPQATIRQAAPDPLTNMDFDIKVRLHLKSNLKRGEVQSVVETYVTNCMYLTTFCAIRNQCVQCTQG